MGPSPPLFILARTQYSTRLADSPLWSSFPRKRMGTGASSGRIQRIKNRSTTLLRAHNPGIRTKKLGRWKTHLVVSEEPSVSVMRQRGIAFSKGYPAEKAIKKLIVNSLVSKKLQKPHRKTCKAKMLSLICSPAKLWLWKIFFQLKFKKVHPV